jgi:hypothetical protein
MACAKRGFFPGRSSQLKFPLVARMSWRGLLPTHPEAHLWPSEVGTLGRLHALKGVGTRPF